jgi:hypothetical protein
MQRRQFCKVSPSLVPVTLATVDSLPWRRSSFFVAEKSQQQMRYVIELLVVVARRSLRNVASHSTGSAFGKNELNGQN